ncbi:MAG TPA: hypothetical protein V6C72_06025, partial [Chroococcales cyanobacterium]
MSEAAFREISRAPKRQQKGVRALALSAAVAALLLTSNLATAAAELTARAVRTAGQERLADVGAVVWQKASKKTPADIVVDPAARYQDILGFGGAFTDSACYNFAQLNSGDRQKLFHELFDADKLNFSVCRTCIGSSDYASVA